MDHPFIKTDHIEEEVKLAAELSTRFREKAPDYDHEALFPFDHFQLLKESGYTSLTVPEEYGGKGISLTELILVQETIAQGDAATALGIGWHLGVIMDLAVRREWEEESFKDLCLEITKDNKLVNRAMTEPQTGSPTRGGKPQTQAKPTSSGWVLNGRKTFTTLAPAADYFLVNAAVVGKEEVAGFLVDRHSIGLSFEETWDTMAMRATRSDDLILENVGLPASAKVETFDGSRKEEKLPPAWLLHIPAVYIGIALAARRDVIDFAENYQPNSLDHPIKDVTRVREQMGEIELELIKARYTLYGVAREWDEHPEHRLAMGEQLAAAKTIAVTAATKIVDLSIRIVGGKSIYKKLPFERYYRDVLAGSFNPPTDDSVLRALASRAFKD